MSVEETVETKMTNETKEAQDKLREEIVTELAGILFKESQTMIVEYKILMKHTGGLLANSMGFAYSRGLNDAIKFILNQNRRNNEKSV